MHHPVTRRRFLGQSLGAGLALGAAPLLLPQAAFGMQPLQRSGRPRLLLSLAAYSFRDYFRESNHQPAAGTAAARNLDLFQFIDFCADHGCYGTELTSYYFPTPVTTEFLLKLKRHAFLRGITISGTAVGNSFTATSPEKRRQEIAAVKQWIDRAQILGAPHIRVFAGSADGSSKEEARGHAVAALRECCHYAGEKGVVLGLENHGGIVAEAEDLLEIVRAVDSDWFGVNLDTGNFNTADPYGDLRRCAPYAVNVQLKTELQVRGQKKEAADLPRLVQLLREAGYQGYVALEYEAAEDPWPAVPRVLAQLRSLCG